MGEKWFDPQGRLCYFIERQFYNDVTLQVGRKSPAEAAF